MKSLEEFKTFYDTSLITELSEMEKDRKKAVGLFWMIIGILLGTTGAAIGVGVSGAPIPIAIGIGVVGLVFIIILAVKVGKVRKTLKQKYKETVIRPMVHFIDESLVYEAYSKIPQSDFTASKIFTQGVDRYKGDDFIQGKIGETAIRFSEIHAEYYTTDKDGKRQYHTIFKGLFLIADFNKHFNGETYVLIDTAEKLFGKLGKIFQKANFVRPQLVKMEDPVFEKEFVVYGSDQIESRYILTPAMMERMMKLKKKSNKVQFSFKNSQVNIALPVSKNLFEAPLFKSMLNFDQVQEYYEYLLLAIGVVEDLDLNTRIWTKQ